MVCAQRPHSIARGGVEGDQTPVRRLAQRILPQEPLRIADRLCEPPPRLELLDEALESARVEPREPFALLQQPLVVVALEQLAPVRLDRVFEAALGEGAFERRDVEPQRYVGMPLQRARTGVDEPIRVGQRPAQVV